MFIITNYKIFERFEEEFKSTIQFDNMDRWSIIIDDIMSKSDYIKKEFDIIVIDRNHSVKSKQYFPYIDIYKVVKDYEEESSIPCAVYDVCNKQFKLFYADGKSLRSGNYLIIKSENFFDRLEDVYYKIYID